MATIYAPDGELKMKARNISFKLENYPIHPEDRSSEEKDFNFIVITKALGGMDISGKNFKEIFLEMGKWIDERLGTK